MLSGSYLKQPRGKDENVPGKLALVKENVRNADWESAQQDLEDTEKAWKKVIPRIQFSMERDEINNLGISLARARAAITAKDKAGALMELEEAASHWHNLGN
ncbi:MAG TPA: DUF4363 family protein [Syntrophomonadaceae bacterium]|nr:DUF4363 family protein [Syntrophomonadaceae bacterium]